MLRPNDVLDFAVDQMQTIHAAPHGSESSAQAIGNLRDALAYIGATTKAWRDEWRRNPRNCYQPYMFYSRRIPRYQARYPV